MEKMRSILKDLMEQAGDNPYTVQKKAGVPRTTTYRFLAGGHSEPRSDTVKKWAKLYNVTESQLRGDVPIKGIEIPSEKPELKDLLPLDEYQFLSTVKNMDKNVRGVFYKLAEFLVAEPQAMYQAVDRRKENVFPNQQLRIGDSRHKTSMNKKRRNIHFDGRKYIKHSQNA